MSIKRRLSGLMISIAVLCGVLTVTSTPAHATASYWVYILV